MTSSDIFELALIVLLAAGGQAIGTRLRLPSIVLLLPLGFIFGAVLGVLDPDELFGDLLVPFVSLSVAVILFDGGLGLRFASVPEGAHRAVAGLLTVGIAVTWVAASLSILALFDLSTQMSVLLGAILIVSGPTVVIPILRAARLGGRVATVTRWEGILIDPIGAIIAVVTFHLIVTGVSFNTLHGAEDFLLTIAVGVLAGGVGAVALFLILRFGGLSQSLEVGLTLALVLMTYAVPDVLLEDSGFLAVVLMGMAIANQRRVPIAHIAEFKEIVGGILTGILFIVLSARVSASSLTDVLPASLALVAVLVVLVRPLAVALSTLRSRLSLRERAFLAWMAPRGIVAASVASVFALELEDRGVPGAADLVPVTFIVIVATTALYGLSARPVARLLGVADDSEREGARG